MNFDTTSKIIVIGDFNMKSLVKTELYNGKFEKYMLQHFNCGQYISEVTTNYESKLDLVFANFKPQMTNIIDPCPRSVRH